MKRYTAYYDILLKTTAGEEFVVRGFERDAEYYHVECVVMDLPEQTRKQYTRDREQQGHSVLPFDYVQILVPKSDALRVIPVSDERMWQPVKADAASLTEKEQAIIDAVRARDLRATLMAVLNAFEQQ